MWVVEKRKVSEARVDEGWEDKGVRLILSSEA